MYITPNSTIRILRNVPLDTSYDHTLWFANAGYQAAYFAGMQKYTESDYTYQRVNRGYIRVGRKADDLYDCNYLMFRNDSFGDKWFYAFITSVEYVNNQCSDIQYEIDAMQTWLFDHQPDYCFVEREHTISDQIGEHIEAEALDVGEYVFNSYGPLSYMNKMCVSIAIVDVDGQTDGNIYDGVYGAAQLWVYDADDETGINAKINEYTQKPDSIISIYMFPKSFLLNEQIPAGNRLYGSEKAITRYPEMDAVSTSMALDGYIPKNRKLYTYPYHFVHIDNAAGSSLSLRYEYFLNMKPKFSIYGTITQPVTALLRPVNYKRVGGSTSLTPLNTENLQLSSYPICSWNVDSYQAWVAQNSVVLQNQAKSSLASLAFGALSPNPLILAGAGLSLLGKATSAMQQAYQASISADITKGSFNNGGPNVAAGMQQFYCGRASVSYQYARSIDEYFTMFGYAVRRVKVPNRNSRPHWNYVKTVGATVTGSVPADDMRKICSIYDNGITFWKNGQEVGNYALDNSP